MEMVADLAVYISPVFALIIFSYCLYRLCLDCTKCGQSRRRSRARRPSGAYGPNIYPAPTIPPPTYDRQDSIHSNRAYVISTEDELPKYEDAVKMSYYHPPIYSITKAYEDFMPPSYERARAHTTYPSQQCRPAGPGSFRRSSSLPQLQNVLQNETLESAQHDLGSSPTAPENPSAPQLIGRSVNVPVTVHRGVTFPDVPSNI
ncbi:hypothetical protein AB6A40_004457 [Gnathostoma spinigerum]|uniref:Uncharacterized protein n=1 Tax=Gnathostoma spinigerum TaxID=75299 RepID=A0ABD6ECP7_9BILA